MECQKKEKQDRVSDFSIDHILNRAGEKCTCVRKCEATVVDSERQLEPEVAMPMFDWLQYTRYRPPKIPRPFRSGPVKRTPGRLPRVPFTPGQLNALETAYKSSTYLSSEEANKLAAELNLTNTRVKIWFQNRRARERREKRENEEKMGRESSSSASSSPEPQVFVPRYPFC
ncbi:unnamed protein product [Hermetia illucens]|uniref:Homeobox domain-containing protein n=1 Tax=Hermetia illucens TaxID=343691 RepID=A0A7R8UPC2_HERIL|nr:homeobox protein MSX-2-like [Hermetia illucens]CAD7084205.1 unnamed protein product [Hermetia illucens]